MNAEFNWWLLIVGVVGGAGLLWLVLGDWSRRDEDLGAAERAREAEWIAEVLRDEGTPLDPATAETVLRLHRAWLRDAGTDERPSDETPADEASVDERPVDERELDEAPTGEAPTGEAPTGEGDPDAPDRGRAEAAPGAIPAPSGGGHATSMEGDGPQR